MVMWHGCLLMWNVASISCVFHAYVLSLILSSPYRLAQPNDPCEKDAEPDEYLLFEDDGLETFENKEHEGIGE